MLPHKATCECEAYTVRKQALRISTEIGSRSDADVIHEAEGSIRQQPLREGVLKSAVSLAHGMFPKRLAGSPRELANYFSISSIIEIRKCTERPLKGGFLNFIHRALLSRT